MARRVAASFFKNIYVFLILVGCDPFDILERYFGVIYNPPTWLRVLLVVIAVGLASWRTIEDTKKGIDNEEKLNAIRDAFIDIDKYEKEAAIKQSKNPPSNNVKARITQDLVTLYPLSHVESIIREGVERDNPDPLINFYENFGEILDANNCGLKAQLEGMPQYNETLAKLTGTSVGLRFRKKKMDLIHGNIERLLRGEYGLNSGIILRNMLKTSQPRSKSEGDFVHSAVLGLEKLENIGRQFLAYGLGHLDSRWKPHFTAEQLKSPQMQVLLGGIPRLNRKRFGMLHAFRDMINRQGQGKQR
jgi:hypothetical protein